MVRVAAKDRASPELIDDAGSRALSRSLNAELPCSQFPESSRVTFFGYVVWLSEKTGDRNLHDEQVFVARQGEVRPLAPRNDLADQSPDGLSWGYAGSAPGQLALAMLMEVLNDWPRVRRIYHDFHMLFVRNIPRGANWTADGSDILAWALELESKLPNS
jgi:hypothetical protein